MTNAYSLFRSLIIYGICLPLAIFVGYLLADPLDITTFASVGLLLGLLMVPILLRFHYPWLLLTWNATAGLFFLPGRPSFALVMIAISFTISLLSYIMNRNLKFISVPSMTWPLVFLTLVVLATAQLTGGIGLNILGSSGIGGKRYIYFLASIFGFFALIARKIPAEKTNLYTNLYFLGSATAVIGHLAALISPSLYFIFLIFPADTAGMESTLNPTNPNTPTITRLGGLAVTSMSLMSWLLARYGIGGLLNSKTYWRLFAFLACLVACMFGGFRSMLITIALTCGILFYLEGLMSSRLLPVVMLGFVLMAATILPFANKLPLSVQRSLTFIPLNLGIPLNLDVEAEMSAKASSEWRLEMWKEVLPTVPQYLILGKGLSIDAAEMDMLVSGMNRGTIGAAGSELAGDYHNGPLSIIIPFGIFGFGGFIWFLVAGWRVLYRNYRYGDAAHQNLNRFLLAFFIVKILIFFLIFGSFCGDMFSFGGAVALSIAMNGGVRQPVAEPVAPRQPFKRFKLAEATR